MMTRWLLALLFCTTCVASAQAGTGPEALQAFLKNTRTLEADFDQRQVDAQGRVGRYSGKLYLERPGRFRWDYAVPVGQLIVGDGKRVWFLDPDLEQVSHQSQDSALRGTPAAVLIGEKDIGDAFEIVDLGRSRQMDWVELLPKDEGSQFERITLAFDKGVIATLEMEDKFGQTTRFRFHDVKSNIELKPALFKFRQPNGFDVFEY